MINENGILKREEKQFFEERIGCLNRFSKCRQI